MQKTKYEGVYFVIGADGKKNYKVRFWVHGKEYKRTIGKEPLWTAKSASLERERLIDEYINGEITQIKKMDDMFIEYLNDRGTKLSKWWKKNNTYLYKNHISPAIGHLKADTIKRHMIQKIVDDMLNKGYKPKTAKDVKDTLSAFFKYYDLPNPAARVDIPKFDNSVQFDLTIEECKKVYDAIVNYDNTKYRCFFTLLLHGRRRGEAMSIRVENIDFNEKVYIIKYEDNKRRKTVTHPLTPMLEKMMLTLIKQEKIISGYLFRGRKEGTHISPYAVEYHWQKIKEKSGVKLRLHDLRHMIGYLGVNMGASLEQIGKVLDHTNISTTKRYSNVRIQQAGTLLDNIFETLKRESN